MNERVGTYQKIIKLETMNAYGKYEMLAVGLTRENKR